MRSTLLLFTFSEDPCVFPSSLRGKCVLLLQELFLPFVFFILASVTSGKFLHKFSLSSLDCTLPPPGFSSQNKRDGAQVSCIYIHTSLSLRILCSLTKGLTKWHVLWYFFISRSLIIAMQSGFCSRVSEILLRNVSRGLLITGLVLFDVSLVCVNVVCSILKCSLWDSVILNSPGCFPTSMNIPFQASLLAPSYSQFFFSLGPFSLRVQTSPNLSLPNVPLGTPLQNTQNHISFSLLKLTSFCP